jgi:hypothetical protein
MALLSTVLVDGEDPYLPVSFLKSAVEIYQSRITREHFGRLERPAQLQTISVGLKFAIPCISKTKRENFGEDALCLYFQQSKAKIPAPRPRPSSQASWDSS